MVSGQNTFNFRVNPAQGNNLAISLVGQLDIIFLQCPGVNDFSFSDAAVAAACVQLAGYARAAQPNAIIMCVGEESPPQTQQSSARYNTVGAAIAAIGDPYTFFLNNAAQSVIGQWQTGTGNTGSPNGTGNADIYMNTDNVHPNIAGHKNLGRQIGAATVDVLRSLV